MSAEIKRRSEYFLQKAKREQQAGPEMIQITGGVVGGPPTELKVYALQTVNTGAPASLTVRLCQMIWSETQGYRFIEISPPQTIIAYPHPAVDVLFYNGLQSQMFFGHTINGIVFLDAQPWSSY
jgi:hypothetical protein